MTVGDDHTEVEASGRQHAHEAVADRTLRLEHREPRVERAAFDRRGKQRGVRAAPGPIRLGDHRHDRFPPSHQEVETRHREVRRAEEGYPHYSDRWPSSSGVTFRITPWPLCSFLNRA